MAAMLSDEHVTRWGKFPAWWLLHPGTDADRVAVLAALATYADEAGFCEPSQATLARRLGRSRPWANRVVADLVTAGLLRKEARSRSNGGTTSCRYQLALTPDEAALFLLQTTGRPVPTTTASCLAADTPRHQGDTNQTNIEQSHKARPDTREAADPDRGEQNSGNGRILPERGWSPPQESVEHAVRLCPDVDLDAHTAHFVARCRAKGYRYSSIAMADAWLSWLLEDNRRNAQHAGLVRGVQPSSSYTHSPTERAEKRLSAWAAAAAAPRHRWS